jgi:hypothetical protein
MNSRAKRMNSRAERMNSRAERMRERAGAFERMAMEARDPVLQAELKRLSILYAAQAERIEHGEDLPSDPGETG